MSTLQRINVKVTELEEEVLKLRRQKDIEQLRDRLSGLRALLQDITKKHDTNPDSEED